MRTILVSCSLCGASTDMKIHYVHLEAETGGGGGERKSSSISSWPEETFVEFRYSHCMSAVIMRSPYPPSPQWGWYDDVEFLPGYNIPAGQPFLVMPFRCISLGRPIEKTTILLKPHSLLPS
jgi:hypothetical protein